MTKIKLFSNPDGKTHDATFDSVNELGKRVKHYIIKSNIDGGYVHITRCLILDEHCTDIELGADSPVQVSDRVFFGKYRLLEIIEDHKAETWLAIAEIVRFMEK